MPNQKNKSRLDFMLHVVTPLFIAGGVFCAYLLMTTFWGCVVTQFWVETPATILSAELIVSRGPKSDTYRIHATYNYTYDGYSHHGTKVTPYRGNDSDNDSYARRIHQELLHYQESGESFRCFVNPMNPSKAVLYRDFRGWYFWYLLIGTLLFCGVGFGLPIGSILLNRLKQAETDLIEKHPDKPWLWKIEYSKGRIVSTDKGTMWKAIIFTVVWNLFSSLSLPPFFSAFTDKNNGPAILCGIFPLIGIGFIVWAVRCVSRYRKFGQSVFEMEPVPALIGGTLSGVVKTSVNVNPENGFQLTLNYIKRTTRHSISENVLWTRSSTVPNERWEHNDRHSSIPVRIEIPLDKKGSDSSTRLDQIIWRLNVSAKVDGIDFSSDFDVPVYKIPSTSMTEGHDSI